MNNHIFPAIGTMLVAELKTQHFTVLPYASGVFSTSVRYSSGFFLNVWR
ncbi:hypothetical protein JFY74_14305 [Pectobacterium carotovorum]|nr:hypothetical protein JFY74_14305 [Pectobacterium carotovorum]